MEIEPISVKQLEHLVMIRHEAILQKYTSAIKLPQELVMGLASGFAKMAEALDNDLSDDEQRDILFEIYALMSRFDDADLN